MIAHKRAWEQHNILHRDFSAGNILIYDIIKNGSVESTVGLLSDWELSKSRADVMNPSASRLSRSVSAIHALYGSSLTHLITQGTWQFMSSGLQWHPRKPHMLPDDLEAIYHVLNWSALKYLPHVLTGDPGQLRKAVHDTYDTELNGKCLYYKFERVNKGVSFVDLQCGPNHPFLGLLTRLGAICKEHYARFPPSQIEKDTIDGRFKYPSGPIDRVVAEVPSPWRHYEHAQIIHIDRPGAVVSLEDGASWSARQRHLYDHEDIVDAFASTLKRPMTEWSEITKLPDQVPTVIPSSSASLKRAADDRQGEGSKSQGGSAKKLKTKHADGRASSDAAGLQQASSDSGSSSGGSLRVQGSQQASAGGATKGKQPQPKRK